MDVEVLKSLISDACAKVALLDRVLFDVKATERTFQFRLAHYLACDSRLPAGVSVDCEYSRDGMNVKRISGSAQGSWFAPDVLIHRRVEAGDNLAAIELKFSGDSKGVQKDRRRLAVLCQEFNYRSAFLVLINKETQSLDIEFVNNA